MSSVTPAADAFATFSAESAITDQPYAYDPDDVLAAYAVSDDGLTSDVAIARLAEVGPNSLPQTKPESPLRRFLRQMDDVLIYILLAAAALKAIIGDWVDFGVILAVALLNGVIGFVQEGRAEKALEGIAKMLSSTAAVRRDGDWQEVPAEDLVPGDVIRVHAGDRVPADARLLAAANLQVEESALTGEAVSSSKRIDPVDPDAGVGDRSSMLFSSTIVTAGQGTAVVTATGSQAEIGRIQQLMSEVEQLDTPLTRQLTAFGKVVAIAVLVMAVVMIVIGRVLHDFSVPDLISATIGFAVAAIPEGLPALVTITLALGVQQMAKQQAIVRRLPVVEALGSVTTVCSDKTGTLTRNEMTVRQALVSSGAYEVTGIGYEPDGRIEWAGNPADVGQFPDLALLVTVLAVANDADVADVPDEEGGGTHWRLLGEPTEGALRTLGLKAKVDHQRYARIAVLPFDSEYKLMGTLNAGLDGSRMLMVKGAPDRLLDRCATQLAPDGESEALDRIGWERRIDELSSQGLRVLAACWRPATPDSETLELSDLDSGLEFVGIVGIVDPPRPEAIEAIASCHSAGIRVKMITGDHAGTATAIAREMGIIGPDAPPAITGAELERATDEQLKVLVESADVFARTSPEHKIRLVRALQRNGEVVAMTGDGVNDAPALKRADIGVAMGIKGTEATKQAAGMVLADDNFATIERAVHEGRRIYDNLQKSVVFLLPTNGAQSLVILVAVLLGLTLPLDPVQILWVNLVTAVTLSLALAYEPPEPDLMDRPPRPAKSHILEPIYLPPIALASLLIAGATIGVFLYGQSQGLSLAVVQTTAVNTLVLAQVTYLFNARHLRESSLNLSSLTGNKVVWIVIGVLLVLQAIFVYVPVMNSWFNSAPVGPRGWLIPLALALVVFLILEAGKAGFRAFQRSRSRA
ncbi:MAG TPA: HAD-IC family P-type ATPase [Microlunatus sp.]|nr:HAD-IC family P-type ATPase [Microlunatus sp.]